MSRIREHIDSPSQTLRRYFDLDQANKALVLVRRVVSDVIAHSGRLLDLQETIESAQAGGAYDRSEGAQNELTGVAKRLHECAKELDDIGVELRDWSAGVVDFPCRIDGREAYWCWRYGEERIEFWHELDEDSTGRQPVSDLFAANGAGSK